MEDKTFCTFKKVSAYRKRYDSEMGFDEFVDLYGAPPDPPRLKPLVDPHEDLPPFELQEQTVSDKEECEEKEQKGKEGKVRLYPIAEIEDSQNNSMIFTSPKKERGQFPQLRREAPVPSLKQEQEKPKHFARRRRFQSQTQDYQILTFLSQASKGKKRVKRD